jgi:hypothetical protein
MSSAWSSPQLEALAQLLLGIGFTDRPATTGQIGVYSPLFDLARCNELHTFINDCLGPSSTATELARPTSPPPSPPAACPRSACAAAVPFQHLRG